MASTFDYMIKNNLFEEAYASYEKCRSNRWLGKWWETVCTIYDSCRTWRNKYLLNRDERTVIKRVKEIIEGIIEKVPIIFGNGTKLCYLFKFYDSEGNLLFSKIGTTERAILQRLKEEIRKYKKSFDIYGVVIESVWDCGDIPPEGAESFVRAHFIKNNPTSYVKNDRFLKYDISVAEFNDCVKAYLTS